MYAFDCRPSFYIWLTIIDNDSNNDNSNNDNSVANKYIGHFFATIFIYINMYNNDFTVCNAFVC